MITVGVMINDNCNLWLRKFFNGAEVTGSKERI